jgi:UDP-N-acetylmuramate--alanine ligase
VGANGHWGSGSLVLEVDESYGTFALLEPAVLGLLNVEADHLDHYGSLDALDAAFAALARRTSGPVVAWVDDPGVRRVERLVERGFVTVAADRAATWRVSRMALARRRASFDLDGPGRHLALELGVTGAHNVANAAVVAVLAFSLGVEPSAIVAGLGAFLGVSNSWASGAASTSTRTTRTCPARSPPRWRRPGPPATGESPASSSPTG